MACLLYYNNYSYKPISSWKDMNSRKYKELDSSKEGYL